MGAGPVFDALGNPCRREILELLRAQELEVGSLAEQLPVSRPAVSKHLKILNRAGLVTCRAQGTSNVFKLNREGLQPAKDYLEAFWGEALQSFKAFAEGEPDER